MSTFTSASIRKRDASPPERMNPEENKGIMKSVVGAENLPVAGISTLVKLISIPANAKIHRLEYSRENLGTSRLDIAVWYPTTIPQGALNSVAKSNEGVILGTTIFVSPPAGTDASLGWTDAFGLAATPTLGNNDNPLWQVLGLTNDRAGIEFDIGFTVRTATSTAGYVGLRATYVD